MTSLKLLEVGTNDSKLRSLHLEEFLQKKQIKLEKLVLEKDLNWNEFIPAHKNQFDWMWLSPEWMESCAAEYFKLPEIVRRVGLADTIIQSHSTIWPKIFLLEVLKKFIFIKSPQLDTRAAAYLVGDGALVRLCAFVLISLGYSNIIFVSRNVEKAQKLVAELERQYFSMEFSTLDPNMITLEQAKASCVINTISPALDSELLTDLYYFNFAKKNALIIDFNIFPIESQLLTEATHLGMSTLHALDIYGWMDGRILETLFENKITAEEYFKSWTEFLKNT